MTFKSPRLTDATGAFDQDTVRALKDLDRRLRALETKRTADLFGQTASQTIGFYGVTPVNQPDAVADATDAATAISQLNSVISRLEEVGILATS